MKVKYLYLTEDKISLWIMKDIVIHFQHKNKSKLMLIYLIYNENIIGKEYKVATKEQIKILVISIFKAKKISDYRKEKGYGT
jgi:hypothetical protein